MDRRTLLLGLFCILTWSFAGYAAADDQSSPLTGTWECQSRGGPDGEVAFKLYLQQTGERVDGSLMSSVGDAPLSYGSFRDNTLEIRIDTPDGKYILTAKVRDRNLSGDLRYRKDKGTWEGTKTWPVAK